MLRSWRKSDISIHALREEGDFVITPPTLSQSIFLSTPSARRATQQIKTFYRDGNGFLSTPSARRATALNRSVTDRPKLFLSTPSARRATST